MRKLSVWPEFPQFVILSLRDNSRGQILLFMVEKIQSEVDRKNNKWKGIYSAKRGGEKKLGMLSPELLIKIIQLPMTRISISVPHCTDTHICTSTNTQPTHTHTCSCICTRHFYLAYSTVIFLKWVKTKWKSRNFSLRETDRQGERYTGERREIGWGWREGRSFLIRKVPFKTHKMAKWSHLIFLDTV